MKKSYLIATALTLVICGWLTAGHFTSPSHTETTAGRNDAVASDERMTVAVSSRNARRVTPYIVAQGQAEPNRVVTVRAETAGRMAKILAREGRPVLANDELARIEINGRQAALKKAEALVRERRRAHASAAKLGKKGFQTQRRIDETFSALQTARADLEEIELEIARTAVRAPFAGILEKRQVELGDYVAINGEIATIVDNDPLVVTVQIAQQDVRKLSRNTAVDVSFATGQRGQGVVRFIAPRAEEATRTFRVEVEVPNPDSRIPSGTSAEARIPTAGIFAHFISPALLTLNDSGQIGVKTVNDLDIVEFYPVAIVLAEANGVWVKGLPNAARIITVGHGFVRPGETVRAAPADNEKATAPASNLLSEAMQ